MSLHMARMNDRVQRRMKPASIPESGGVREAIILRRGSIQSSDPDKRGMIGNWLFAARARSEKWTFHMWSAKHQGLRDDCEQASVRLHEKVQEGKSSVPWQFSQH